MSPSLLLHDFSFTDVTSYLTSFYQTTCAVMYSMYVYWISLPCLHVQGIMTLHSHSRPHCHHYLYLCSIIREWNIHSGQCLRDVYGHEAFVYGYVSAQPDVIKKCLPKRMGCEQIAHYTVPEKSLEENQKQYQVRHQSMIVGFINHVKRKLVFEEQCCATQPFFGDFPTILIISRQNINIQTRGNIIGLTSL